MIDVTAEAKKIGNAKKAALPNITEIGKVLDEVNSKDFDKMQAPELEKYAGQLNGFAYQVAKVLTEANLDHNGAYMFRKLKGAKLYFEVEASTAKAREMLAEQKNQEQYVVELANNYYAESVKHLYDNIRSTISLLQSCMSNRRNEFKTNNLQP